MLSSGSLIAEGVIKPSEAAPAADGAASEESCATHGATRDANLYISGGAFYADIARNRLEYGPAFRVLEEMNAAGDTGVLRQGALSTACFLHENPPCPGKFLGIVKDFEEFRRRVV